MLAIIPPIPPSSRRLPHPGRSRAGLQQIDWGGAITHGSQANHWSIVPCMRSFLRPLARHGDGSAVAQGKVIYRITSGRQAPFGYPLLGTSGPGDADRRKNGGLQWKIADPFRKQNNLNPYGDFTASITFSRPLQHSHGLYFGNLTTLIAALSASFGTLTAFNSTFWPSTGISRNPLVLLLHLLTLPAFTTITRPLLAL